MKDKKPKDESKIEKALEYGDRIIATLRESFLVLDKNLRVISANSAFYNTFKVTQKDTLGRSLPDLGDGQWNIPKLLVLLKEILPEKGIVENYEIEHEFEQIGLRCMNLNASQLRVPKEIAAIIAATAKEEEEEEEELILLAIEDITERKSVETEKNRLRVLASTAEAKSKFISMVSHELRSPLAAIKEGTNLVLEGVMGPVNDGQKDILNTAKENIARLGRLINNVLVYQKMEAGKTCYDLKENDLSVVIREAHKSAMLFAGNRKADLVMELGNDLPKLQFDRDKIFQVLTNLMANAINYSEGGTIVIQTRLENSGVHISVRDSGSGIKADCYEKIFEPFSQLENCKMGGTGLGLAISKEIVLAHHGKIWVESEIGKGSTFHFTLPL